MTHKQTTTRVKYKNWCSVHTRRKSEWRKKQQRINRDMNIILLKKNRILNIAPTATFICAIPQQFFSPRFLRFFYISYVSFIHFFRKSSFCRCWRRSTVYICKVETWIQWLFRRCIKWVEKNKRKHFFLSLSLQIFVVTPKKANAQISLVGLWWTVCFRNRLRTQSESDENKHSYTWTFCVCCVWCEWVIKR